MPLPAILAAAAPYALDAAILGSALIPLLGRGAKAVGRGSSRVALARKRRMPLGAAFASGARKGFGKMRFGDYTNLGFAGLIGYNMLQDQVVNPSLEEAAELEAMFGRQFQQQALQRSLGEQRLIEDLLNIPGNVDRASALNMNPAEAAGQQSDIQAMIEKAMADNQILLARAIERPAARPSVMELYRQFGGV